MSYHFINVLSIVALSTLGSSSVLAQSPPTDSTSLRQGAWALQFGVGSNFTLTTFQGSTLAIKYHLSEANALRIAITLNGSFTDGTELQTGVSDTANNTASGDNSSHSGSIAIFLQYLWYMNPRDVVHFYTGVGPSISYSHSQDQRSQNALTSQQEFYSSGYYWSHVNSTTTSNQWALGLRGIAGVEWFPIKWFSFRAEYSEGIQYQWTSSKSAAQGLTYTTPVSSITVSDNVSSKGWVISSLGVSFGVSVYF